MLRIWLIGLLMGIVMDSLAQQIEVVEYFFDQDPGYGNGMKPSITPEDALDINFNADVSELNNGLHILYVRARDNSGSWSLNQSKSFIRLEGSGSGNPQILRIEYFIDEDPGLGNGTSVDISPDQSLDITFSAELSDISNGLHTLYVRSQDNFGQWSLVHSGKFIRLNGAGGELQIIEIEYFFDVDPGVGNGEKLDVTPALKVESDFTIPLPDLPSGSHTLFVRAKDSFGRWSLMSEKEVCFPTAKAGFSTARFGNRFSFIDESKGGENYHWDFGDDITSTISNPIHEFPPGEYNVRQVVWNECSRDTTTLQLSILGIEDFEPKFGGNAGNVTLTVYGGGFTEMTSFKLTKEGENNLLPVTKSVTSSTQLKLTFDLNNKITGIWKLVVEFPELNDSFDEFDFRIEEGIQPIIEINPPPSRFVRFDREASMTINISNGGNINAYGVPLWIVADEDIELEIKDVLDVKFTEDEEALTFDTELGDHYFETDQFFNKKIHDSKVYGVVIERLEPNESVGIDFEMVLSPSPNRNYQNDPPEIYSFSTPPFFGKKFNEDNSQNSSVSQLANPEVTDCLKNCNSSDEPNLVNDIQDYRDALKEVENLTLDDGIEYVEALKRSRNQSLKTATGFAYVLGTKAYGGLVKDGLNGLKKHLGTALGFFGRGLSFLDDSDENCDCHSGFKPNPINPLPSIPNPIRSIDPNEKYSSIGSGLENFQNKRSIDYEIAFENLEAATASAQIVTLMDTLDTSKIDVQSLHLNYFTIGDSTFSIPPNRSEYTTDIDLRPEEDLILRFNAKVDTVTGIFTSKFLSLDTETLELTEDVFAGFLPPNVNAPEGEGRVGFSVRLKDDLQHGTEIRNKATIIFDFNEPITTNETLNTLDLTEPSSSLISQARFQKDSVFNVSWTGSDVGSGVFAYDLYQAVNDDDYELIKFRTSTTESEVKLKKDSIYSFYVVATDSVGNVETKEVTSELITELGKSLVVIDGAVDFGFQDINTSVSQNITISNTGNVELIISDIEVPNGYSLDYSSGIVEPGENQSVTVGFTPDEAISFSGELKVISDAENEENTILLSGTGATRILSLSENIDFGFIDVGKEGQSSFEITNNGNVDLTVSDILFSNDAFFLDWTEGVLGAGSTQIVNVTFSPTSADLQTEILTINSDAISGTNQLTLAGTGAERIIELVGDLNFGDIDVGATASKELTLINNGNVELTISEIQYSAGFSGDFTSGNIASGGSQIVKVKFTPTDGESFSDVITVLSDAQNQENTIDVSGEGTTRVLNINGNLEFGYQDVNTTFTHEFTLSNSGNRDLIISNVEYPNGFSGDFTSGKIAPRTSQTVKVTFEPTVGESFSGSIVVISDAQNEENSIGVSGIGATRILSIEGSLVFGDVDVNKSTTKEFTITNSGNQSLTISEIQFPEGYSGNYSSGVIAPGDSEKVMVTFTPKNGNVFSGCVIVLSNAQNQEDNIEVSGNGITRVLSIAGDLDFGSVDVGKTLEKAFTITNSGNRLLEIIDISLPSGFTHSWENGSIESAQSQEVKITFSPDEAKTFEGQIEISSNATNEYDGIPIKGIGKLVTGLETLESQEISIYPNPVDEEITIDLTKSSINGTIKIEITDLSGKRIYSQKLTIPNKRQVSINVRHLPQGVLNLSIFSQGEIVVSKVLKK